jgi:hypothetical protein
MHERIEKAQKYVNRLSFRDSQSFAQKTLYALIDHHPYPDHLPFQLTRYQQPGAEWQRADTIRKNLRNILYP